MTWCTYLQSFEKIHQCVLTSSCYSVKTKRDGQTDGRTDGQTDGGRCNISRPGPSAPREIKIWKQSDKDFLSYRENDEVSVDAEA